MKVRFGRAQLAGVCVCVLGGAGRTRGGWSARVSESASERVSENENGRVKG